MFNFPMFCFITDCTKFEEEGLIVKKISTFNTFGGSQRYSQQIEVSCDQGYEFQESYFYQKVVPMTCMMGGQWNITWTPHCSRKFNIL